MKPTMITSMLELAWSARMINKTFNPLFTGEAGLGKSEICQQWVSKKQKVNPDFGFLDLRIAYFEGPDMIGFPDKIKVNGVLRQINCLPDFWPTEGEGLILLEEPNRGTTGVMNTLMQMLTDRKVGHKYEIPKGWIFASCINPESAEYDVNHMDTALKNRFEEFEIEYDGVCFLEYMENHEWSETIQMFVGSGAWVYKNSAEVPQGTPYISPRTWSKLDNAEKAGVKDDMSLHRMVAMSILGKHLGDEYWKFCHKESPVTAQDLIKNKKEGLRRLRKQSDPNNYKGDMISITVESIIKNYGGLKPKKDQVNEATMADVARTIMSDHALNLIKGCGFTAAGGQIRTFFKDFSQRHPDLLDIMRSNIRLNRATGTGKPQDQY